MIESHPLSPLVRRWSNYAPLTPGDCNALLSLPFTRKSCTRDSYLVRDGQQVSNCTLLLSGFAFRQKLVRNGGRQIISFHIPTEFVDLQNGLLAVADHSVQCLTPCDIALVPRRALMEIADAHPAISVAMWMETLVDAAIFREWVVNVGRRDSKARIAHLLCEMAVRLKAIGSGQDDTYEFPVTQEQLADATGLTPVHTNRTLQVLRRNRLIQLTARSLKILDWPGLCEAGDFDPTYLHQPPETAERTAEAG